MPWTSFRLRAVSCKLGFGLWRRLVMALAVGKASAVADEPGALLLGHSLKLLRARFHACCSHFTGPRRRVLPPGSPAPLSLPRTCCCSAGSGAPQPAAGCECAEG